MQRRYIPGICLEIQKNYEILCGDIFLKINHILIRLFLYKIKIYVAIVQNTYYV